MSIHMFFHGEIRKMSILFGRKTHLFWNKGLCLMCTFQGFETLYNRYVSLDKAGIQK